MWAKICANTNLDDALLATELGADALGFVFAESKRQVTAAQVARITSHLPERIEKVGVFNSQNADEIAGIVREAGLDTVQLHGGLNPELSIRLQELLGLNIGLIQTLHWAADGAADGSADCRPTIAAQLKEIQSAGTTTRVLVDSRVGQAGGGTGVSFDWKEAGAVFASQDGGLRIIAAGGLRPDNLAEAVALMHPWGVDVASGVESTPGRKDPIKLAEFLRLAKS